MSNVIVTRIATRATEQRGFPCKLMPKLRRLLIVTCLIVPAGGAGALVVVMHLAPLLIQQLCMPQPAEPGADAPEQDQPPPAEPPLRKTQLRMDIKVDREIVAIMGIAQRYERTFWGMKVSENTISCIVDLVTSLPTGGVLYVDDFGQYSTDINAVDGRHIVIRRHEPRWPCREQILADFRDAIEAYLKQEKAKLPDGK
jgi:hypothetical protein